MSLPPVQLQRALTRPVQDAVRAFLFDLERSAERAEALAHEARGNLLTRAWQSAIGITSSADAVGTAAKAQRRALEAYRVRATQLRSDAEARTWLEDARRSGLTDVRVLEEAKGRTSITGAAAEVGKASAADVARHAVDLGNNTLGALKLAPYALLVLGLVWVWIWARRAGP